MSNSRNSSPLWQAEPLSPSQWLVDSVIAAGAFGFACLQLVLAINLLVPDPALRRIIGVHSFAPTPLAIFLIAVTTLPLAARRKFPWATLMVTSAAWTLMQFQIGAVSVSLVGPLIALLTVALLRPRTESIIAGGLLLVLVIVSPLAEVNQPLTQLTLLQNIALVAAIWFAGFALQTRQEYGRVAEERARAAEMTRETLARQRVEAERVRIAREVHDITAHSLSAVSIQAAAAERLVDKDPAAAKEAIGQARATAKTALSDIRAMIGVLRDPEEGARAEATSAPTRGTEHLEELIGYLCDGGVDATLEIDGYDRARVPTHIDVALFGIAREASTNILKHARAHSALIRLWLDGEVVRLTIHDDGHGGDVGVKRSSTDVTTSSADRATAPEVGGQDGAGHGIEGMAERVALLGGTLFTGPATDGGFLVSVAIPVAAR